MAKALDLIGEIEYQSKRDSDKEKTTWILRPLSGFEFMNCVREGFVDDQKFVEKGLIGWRGFPDSKGEEIPFSIDNMGRIPPAIAQDLSFKIQNISVLSEDERKNS